MATLPGANVTTNVPPLPNTTPDVVHPIVPASWDDFGRTAAVVFEYVQKGGKPAADKLIAWLNKERHA